MKLRRIISALIVFTLVMTCAVCSVNAAGTYNVTTTYTLGENGVGSGNISVNAAIEGATADSMVSYIVYTGDAVAEDGSNIVHIDQATVNAEGVATMDSVTAPFADFEGGKVKFVSSVDDAFTAKSSGSKPWNAYVKSVEVFSDVLTGVTFVDKDDNGQATAFYYVTKEGKAVQANPHGNLSSSKRWTEYEMDAWFNGSFETTHMKLVPMEDVVAYIVDIGNADNNRDSRVRLTYTKTSTALDGTANTAQSYTIYNSVEDLDTDGDDVVDTINANVTTNLMINGRYKESVEDGYFGSIELEPGSIILTEKINNPSNNDDYTTVGKAVRYMTVDAQPVYVANDSEYNDSPSVTFLATVSDSCIAERIGLKITAYKNGAISHDGVIAEDIAPVAELGIYESVADMTETGNRFGIKLVDTAETKTGYLDASAYDLEATPVIWDAAANGGEGGWLELSVIGDNNDTLCKYFTVNRTTTATEVVEGE